MPQILAIVEMKVENSLQKVLRRDEPEDLHLRKGEIKLPGRIWQISQLHPVLYWHGWL